MEAMLLDVLKPSWGYFVIYGSLASVCPEKCNAGESCTKHGASGYGCAKTADGCCKTAVDT